MAFLLLHNYTDFIDLNVSLQISNKYINTKRPNYSKKDVIEVGVFNHEKTNTND